MESELKITMAALKQTLLSVSISLSYFCIGLVRGYSAPAVPSIHEVNPGLLPDKNIASWVSSVPPFGAFFGSLVAFPLMHKIGRKYTVLLTSPVWATAWVLIATAETWQVMLVARMLSGFGAGLTLPSAQIYVSECSDPKIRGVIGSLPSLSMSAGILVTYVLGKYIEWRPLAWVCCGISCFLFFAVISFPQSPVWLKTKKRYEKAHNSAKWLHLQGFTFDPKAQQVQKVVGNGAAVEKKEKPFSKEALCRRVVLLPLGIGLALLSIQQLSGIDAVIFFTVEIFRSAGSSLDGHIATIIVGAVQVLSNFSALFVVDRAGRKPLLISSGVIMCASMASMGAAFHLNSIGNTSFGYLPVVSLIVFMIGFSVGFGCIPFLLMGELFPTAQRSLLSSLAGSFNLAVMFIVIKTYHPLEDAITTSGTFWMYSVLCALGVLFVITCVPETKGRDLESIHKLFEKQQEPGASVETPSPQTATEKEKRGHENPVMSTADEITSCNSDTKL
ncbi:facilitated trehalose transporter Tret1-like [Uranotaenia lowii]|uniref:facilitated trehalose transporter Tret1-like n=1 Tax=Uranotaenia lowii TaxID=190385 RepID=UPI002479EA7E|nr:facilitated trehalose transporter Tret1-like [Uranotaenia lowii]XP_055594971.1 facilitated trehalose transporter Tret1-like [Uranotaenia lowii]XP_055594972.1 facilitated trehalose transporter Tret1-like [Uranotaenia lowii]XP_055594973.1 facilitated trehalose transporter Tret1-like [Uranotaenia lowii]XP_055594974.1 facilitated trehalose transporter Tret1-like [Uranotaenia lowii]XP_055594975.1 facilitated trehalose transporter Tret1-like [Uranotaenia lowii]XP_055594976.1 facilitated trehalos